MALAACFLGTAGALADQIKIRGRSYPSVNVLELRDGRLRVVTPGQEVLTPRIDEVDSLTILRPDGDRFEDFNLAERLFEEGKPAQALERYTRAAMRLEGYWADLVRVRMLMAADSAGRVPQAVSYLIQVNGDESTGPEVAIRLLPNVGGQVASEAVIRAVQEITKALDRAQEPDRRAVLQLLLFELQRTGPTDQAEEAARLVVESELSPTLRTVRAYKLKLAALELYCRNNVRESVWQYLDRAIGDCPDSSLPDFLLFKGRLKLRSARSRNEWIRASWPFLRVAIHMEDDPRAAEGLLGAAQALREAGDAEKSASLLQECLQHPKASEPVKAEAQQELDRLRHTE